MLCIKRKGGESIVIDERVTIHIGQVRGNQVAVAIDAPRDIRVRRAELPPTAGPRPKGDAA